MKKIFFGILSLCIAQTLFGLSFKKINPYEIEISDLQKCESYYIEFETPLGNPIGVSKNFRLLIENQSFPFAPATKTQIGAASKIIGSWDPSYEYLKLQTKKAIKIKSERELIYSDIELKQDKKKLIIIFHDLELGHTKNEFGLLYSDPEIVEKLFNNDILGAFAEEDEIRALTTPLQIKNFKNGERYKYYEKRSSDIKEIIQNDYLEMFFNDSTEILYPTYEPQYDIEKEGFWIRTSELGEDLKSLYSDLYYEKLDTVEKCGNETISSMKYNYTFLPMDDEKGITVETTYPKMSISFKIKGVKEIQGKKYTEIVDPKFNFYEELEILNIDGEYSTLDNLLFSIQF